MNTEDKRIEWDIVFYKIKRFLSKFFSGLAYVFVFILSIVLRLLLLIVSTPFLLINFLITWGIGLLGSMFVINLFLAFFNEPLFNAISHGEQGEKWFNYYMFIGFGIACFVTIVSILNILFGDGS